MAKRKRGQHKHARSLSDLERRPGTRKPGQYILIVCEGEKTEPNYFRSLREKLRLLPVEVEIIPGDESGSAPISIVQHALYLKRQRKRNVRKQRTQKLEFDQVWCVFDQENPPHASFSPAVNQARDNRLKLAVSTPAFEYWYLLHYEDTARPFRNADEITKALKKHIPGYEKCRDVYDDCQLSERTSVAIERAKRVWSHRADKREQFPNPSTLVFLLVEKLYGMSAKFAKSAKSADNIRENKQ